MDEKKTVAVEAASADEYSKTAVPMTARKSFMSALIISLGYVFVVTSMQAGIMYGQIGQTEYIIRQIKKETGCQDMKVVATGGLGRAISQETDLIDLYDQTLTLDGLRIIFEKNRS